MEGWVEGPFSLANLALPLPARRRAKIAINVRAANGRRIGRLYGAPHHTRPWPHDWLYSYPSFRTKTWSDAPLPVSLSVNRESRHETLLHFRVALGLEGGPSQVYFNFNLDVVRLPLHTSLAMCFSRDDMALLTRITVPEFFPVLWTFKDASTGPSMQVPLGGRAAHRRLQRRPGPDASGALHAEFRQVWTCLRHWFPNIREINLERYDACNRSGASVRRLRHAAFNPRNPATLLHYMDYGCNSCHYLTQFIVWWFRPIAKDWDQFPLVDYVLDHLNIVRAVWRQDRVSIGTVRVPPGTGGRVYEDVVVRFWTISRSGQPRREPDYRLRCVARSLEGFFGVMSYADWPVCRI